MTHNYTLHPRLLYMKCLNCLEKEKNDIIVNRDKKKSACLNLKGVAASPSVPLLLKLCAPFVFLPLSEEIINHPGSHNAYYCEQDSFCFSGVP